MLWQFEEHYGSTSAVATNQSSLASGGEIEYPKSPLAPSMRRYPFAS
jgi:hypothetical protein